MPWWFYVLLGCAPVIAVLARPTSGGVVIWTVAATWVAITLAIGFVDIDGTAVFAFIVMPVLIVILAPVIATSLAPEPRRWFPAGFFALAGYWLGMMILLFGIATPSDVWEDAIFVALPSVYGATGAAFGATYPA